MNKAFIVYTTTGDPWELCGGTYLVIAENAEQAKKDTETYLDDNKLDEVITGVNEYYKKDPGYFVERLQQPIVE